MFLFWSPDSFRCVWARGWFLLKDGIFSVQARGCGLVRLTTVDFVHLVGGWFPGSSGFFCGGAQSFVCVGLRLHVVGVQHGLFFGLAGGCLQASALSAAGP